MDILTFVAQLTAALAWPVTVLIVILLLRQPLKELIPTLQRLRYRDLEAEFGKGLNEVEVRINQASLPAHEEAQASTSQTRSGEKVSVSEYAKRLATISPRAAIIETWREVEQALIDLAKRRDIPETRIPRELISRLGEDGALSSDIILMLDQMRQLRNEAAHASEFALKPTQAIEYGVLAERIITTLD
jgi:hypothetical protein